MWYTRCSTWWAPNVLHVICTQLHPGRDEHPMCCTWFAHSCALAVMSTQCVARDLHTVAPWPWWAPNVLHVICTQLRPGRDERPTCCTWFAHSCAQCVARDLHTVAPWLWWAPNVLHVICTQLRPGHLSICVGDSSQHSEELQQIWNCVLQCNYYLLLLLLLLLITSKLSLVHFRPNRCSSWFFHWVMHLLNGHPHLSSYLSVSGRWQNFALFLFNRGLWNLMTFLSITL